MIKRQSSTEDGNKQIRLGDLPDDMQVLISQLVNRDLPDYVTAHAIDVTRFPTGASIALVPDDRGSEYAAAMTGDTPPLLVYGRHFVDGKHRLWVIDLEQLGKTSINADQCMRANSMGLIEILPTGASSYLPV